MREQLVWNEQSDTIRGSISNQAIIRRCPIDPKMWNLYPSCGGPDELYYKALAILRTYEGLYAATGQDLVDMCGEILVRADVIVVSNDPEAGGINTEFEHLELEQFDIVRAREFISKHMDDEYYDSDCVFTVCNSEFMQANVNAGGNGELESYPVEFHFMRRML